MVALGVGQQFVEAVALAQNGGIAGFQEVGGDVVSYIGAEAVDQLTELATYLGVPHGPSAVALAVGHGVVRPDLEGFAGLVFWAWHVSGNLDPWRIGAINHKNQIAGRLVRAALQVLTGILIGTLMIGILICRRFFRPLLGFFSDLARIFFRVRSDFFPTFVLWWGRIFFRPIKLLIPLDRLLGQAKKSDVRCTGKLNQTGFFQSLQQAVSSVWLVGEEWQLLDDLGLAQREEDPVVSLDWLGPARAAVDEGEQQGLLRIQPPLQRLHLIDRDGELHIRPSRPVWPVQGNDPRTSEAGFRGGIEDW